jgi:hypothetical protein
VLGSTLDDRGRKPSAGRCATSEDPCGRATSWLLLQINRLKHPTESPVATQRRAHACHLVSWHFDARVTKNTKDRLDMKLKTIRGSKTFHPPAQKRNGAEAPSLVSHFDEMLAAIAHLQPEVERLAKELRSLLLRSGVLRSVDSLIADIQQEAFDALNKHPDDLPVHFRSLGNPTTEPAKWRRRYELASHCGAAQVRLAPMGTNFMPVRCLVAASPERGWRDVRVLVTKEPWMLTRRGVIEEIRVITAPNAETLLAAAAALDVTVSKSPYLP